MPPISGRNSKRQTNCAFSAVGHCLFKRSKWIPGLIRSPLTEHQTFSSCKCPFGFHLYIYGIVSGSGFSTLEERWFQSTTFSSSSFGNAWSWKHFHYAASGNLRAWDKFTGGGVPALITVGTTVRIFWILANACLCVLVGLCCAYFSWISPLRTFVIWPFCNWNMMCFMLSVEI